MFTPTSTITSKPARIAVPLLPILFIVAASLTGCLTRDSGASSESPGTTDESRSSVASQEKARDYIFDTPEDTVVETPWFTVSSIILQVQRTQPETVIVAPPDSRSQRILALRPGSVYPTTTIPGNRFLFHLGIITDDAPPFTTTPERLRQSEPYE